jgi:hypothetical protein
MADWASPEIATQLEMRDAIDMAWWDEPEEEATIPERPRWGPMTQKEIEQRLASFAERRVEASWQAIERLRLRTVRRDPIRPLASALPTETRGLAI